MSGVQLSDKHFFLTSSEDIQLFCQPTLKKFGLGMFVYARYYHDGNCFLLANHSGWLQYHLSQGYFAPAPLPVSLLEKNECFHIIPEEGPFSKAKHDLMQRYQCGQAVDYVVRQANYYEVACFSFLSDDKNALNVMINHLHEFKNFIDVFKDGMENVLQQAENHKIYLPQTMRGIPVLSDSIQKTSKEQRKGVLSQRQREVLYWLTRGKTVKEAAMKLNLSSRTVEHYVTNLKIKMNVSSKSELIEKYLSSSFSF